MLYKLYNMLSSSTPKILVEGSLVTPEPFKVESKSSLQGTDGKGLPFGIVYQQIVCIELLRQAAETPVHNKLQGNGKDI